MKQGSEVKVKEMEKEKKMDMEEDSEEGKEMLMKEEVNIKGEKKEMRR